MDTAMMDPETLQARTVAEEACRALIQAYIDKNLREGVDFGAIVPRRGAKPSLLKPGAEKMCLLLQLRPHFVPDRATLAMAGNPPGLFAFICKLVHTPTGVVIGEGRGTADLSEKQQWTVNSAVKIAEKRAQVDAVLRVAALSDFFTQDLEDGAESEQARPQTTAQYQRPRQQPQEPRNGQQATPNTHQPANAARPPAGNGSESSQPPRVTDEQQKQIRDLIGGSGMVMDELLDQLNITSLGELSAERARKVIERLTQLGQDRKARAAQAAPDPNSPVANTPRLQAVR